MAASMREGERPVCPNGDRTDKSARNALNKAGEATSKAGRAVMLGLGWVTSPSSPTEQKGCLVYILIAIALPIAAVIFFEITRPR